MRYIIVGYGNIGHKRQAVLGKKCVATVDPDKKVKAIYKSHTDVPLEIFDAAVLTVPQEFKNELVKYFLSKGKHVLVEKPLLVTKKQADVFKKLAKKNKVIWHTSYNHRFEPNIVKINKLLNANKIGKLYHAKLVYSFGNIKERIGTWRETENGVLEEIAPHVIDFTMMFFGYRGIDFKPLIARKVESNIIDHWVFATKDNRVMIETSSVTWKNVFSIDIYGELGSIHMYGLNKWGGSDLFVRKRIFPSGIPKENKYHTSPPDLTWVKDFRYFQKMVRENKNSYSSDLEMSKAIANIT